MTFDAQKGNIGRRPCAIVEIDFDRCDLTYAGAPCTAPAATGANIGNECYNTFKTCLDVANFDNSDVLTVRFSSKESAAILGENIFPALGKLNFAPSKLVPGKGLSQRAKVTINLDDFTQTDTYIDPYPANRDYIATDQGTFFGRLMARNPHYVGRALRVKLGYYPDDGSPATLADFDKEYHYVIDRIEGPDSKGKVKIIGKDMLSLADGLKTQTPEASAGTLAAAITGTPSTFSLGAGEGAAYNTVGAVRIGDELITYTRSGDVFTITSRGAYGSASADHDIDESVQACVRWLNVRVDAVISDILIYTVGIDAGFIPTTDWAAEALTWLDDYDLYNIVSEPTSVTELLNQICVECGVDLWWSDEDQEVKFKAQVPELAAITAEINDDIMIAQKATIVDDIKERLSQVYFYVGTKNYAADRAEVGNFDNVVVRADADSEGANEYSSKGIKKVYCRWLSTVSQAGQQASRLISRYKTPPKRLKAEIDISEDGIKTGDHFLINSSLVQGITGANQSSEMQLLSSQLDPAKQVLKIEALTFRYTTSRIGVITATGIGDYTGATTGEQDAYGWMSSATSLLMSNGDKPYQVA